MANTLKYTFNNEKLLDEILADQHHSNDEWKVLIKKAIIRLSVWNVSILKITKDGIRNEDKKDGKHESELSFGELLPAVELLLDTTETTSNQISRILLEFNDILLDRNPLDIIRIHSICKGLTKEIYSISNVNPYIILAVLAIFDIHIDKYKNTNLNINNRIPLIEIYPTMIRPMVTGLNIGILQTKWDRFFCNFFCDRKSNTVIEAKNRKEFDNKRTLQLLDEFNSSLNKHKIKAEIDSSEYINLCQHVENIAGIDIANTIFLKVISSTYLGCYQAEAWLEKLGVVEPLFLRKSLLTPENNGARRFEIGVLIENDSRLIIARIGTQETFYLNDWGKLLHYDNYANEIFSMHDNLKSNSDNKSNIFIYKTTGELVKCNKRSTVAEFINAEYPTKNCEILGVFINGYPVDLGYQLENLDLIDVVFKNDYRCQQISARNSYLSNETKLQRVRTIRTHQEEKNSLLGKIRVTSEVQRYLEPWKFKIDEDQISILLNEFKHLFNKMTLEEIFIQLADIRDFDNEISQYALQYMMRGRFNLKNGECLPVIYNWKNTKIAQCCKPNFDDEIIGHVWRGPKNPDHPAYQRFHELKIHKKECASVQSIENILDVVWSSSDKHPYGLVFEVLIKDEFGCLGELLDIFYNSNLTIHSLRADAIHFQNKASILIFSTAFTKDELYEVKRLLLERYGQYSIKTRDLRKLEVAQLINKSKSNPYIISSESEMEKNLPILFLGRDKELNKLIYTFHDDHTRRVLINGYYRVGKTWFLKQFKTVFLMPKRLIVYISVNNILIDKNPIRDFVYDVYLETIKNLSINSLLTDDLLQRPQNFNELQNWFEKIYVKTGYDFILLMDEFSVINDWEKNKKIDLDFIRLLRNFIFNIPSVSFVLVFQSSYVHNLVEIESGFHDELYEYFRGHHDAEIILKPFSRKEIKELLTQPASDFYQFSKNALDYSYHLCGGVPFIGALLGKAIWDYAQDKSIKTITLRVLQEIAQEINNDPAWEGYLGTLVNKLRGKDTFMVLRKLSELEHKIGPKFIFRDLIQKNLKSISGERVNEAMDSLLKANLVEFKENSFRISGSLLSFYLSRQEIKSSKANPKYD